MAGWKKVKNLFWVGDESRPQNPSATSPEEGAEALLADKYALPEEDATGPNLPAGKRMEDLARKATVHGHSGPASPAAPGGAPDVTHPPSARSADAGGDAGPPIDFQALYDEAEVPNTDEVEALETFLEGLEDSLPQASKLSAAKAFLRAIGKGSEDVMNDAAQKIRVVRALLQTKETETNAFLEAEQKKIDAYMRQIEKHKVAMEESRLTLERVRRQCEGEEARLQTARVFFGHMAEEVR